jgi:hypothetical protein
MVEMIQELSKMQVKQFVLENTLYDFREKLNNLLETVLVQSELKGLLLNFKIEKDVPIKVLSDPIKI